MASTTIESISEALQQIEAKKSSLKEAFEALHSQSPVLSSFSLTWTDLDAHFTVIQASLAQKFRDLQTLATQSNVAAAEPAEPAAPRPEMVELCEKKDGVGLLRYVCKAKKNDKELVLSELPSAMQRSPDAAAMVLDAVGGFFKRGKDPELSGARRTCVDLLEALIAAELSVGEETRERARAMALEWNKELNSEEVTPMEMQGFLSLVAAFGLVSEFSVDEIVRYLSVIVKNPKSVELCRKIDLKDHLEDLINIIIKQGKSLFAINFIIEFGLTKKFPPISLLKAYVKESENTARNVCKEGQYSLKSRNEATSKEVSALKAVLKVIRKHKLESEYPEEVLENRISQLQKEVADRKRAPAAFLGSKPSGKDRPMHQNGNKRPRFDVPPRAANSPVPIFQNPHFPSTGSFPNSCVGSSSLPFPNPNFNAGSSSAILGNPSLATSHVYPAESYVPPAFYDRPSSHGEYALHPQYQPSYYPQ